MAKDRNESINSYITDMLALEQHLEKAIRGQLHDIKDDAEFVRELQPVHRKIEHHISDLKGLVERRDATGAADLLKRAGSAVAGLAAGAIDLLRTEGLPKNLRDDYTAFSLATIGYVMLHTTALALGEREVADLARQHFVDYAQVVTRLNTVVPEAVLRFLQREGLTPTGSDVVLLEVNRMVEEGWRRSEGLPQSGAPVTPRP